MSEQRARILGMLASGKITVEEAEKLLDALGENAPPAGPQSTQPASVHSGEVKFLRVHVVSTQGDNVNVRVPLNLVRAGMKLTSLIPPQAMDKINSSMAEAGVKIDLNSVKPEDIEALIESLREMEVDVDAGNGDKVRVFCE